MGGNLSRIQNRNQLHQSHAAAKIEPVSIAGISGRFPDNGSASWFHNDCSSTDADLPKTLQTNGVPISLGKLRQPHVFHSEYFRIDANEAYLMDTEIRILLKASCEALIDAGVNPITMRNANTGVFIGLEGIESDGTNSRTAHDGAFQNLFANTISSYLSLNGPSYDTDSGSFAALQHALMAIRMGHCEAAIVGGAHISRNPSTSSSKEENLELSHGMKRDTLIDSTSTELSWTVEQPVAAIYITRADTTPRSYAKILHTETRMGDFPTETVGHLQDAESITEKFSSVPDANNNLPDPGLFKNNADPSLRLFALAKLVLSIRRGIEATCMPVSNIDFPSLNEAQLREITEFAYLKGHCIGVSSLKITGGAAHVILQLNSKTEPDILSRDCTLPTLIPFSGHTEESVRDVLAKISSRARDEEQVKLLQKICLTLIPDPRHRFRGYAVMDLCKPETNIKSRKIPTGAPPPVWFIFPGMGSQWTGMAKDLLQLETFRKRLEQCSSFLYPFGIDLYGALLRGSEQVANYLPVCFASIVSIQIAMIDLMRSIGITANGMIGHSAGELACAYADYCLTAEQTVIAAYSRGKALLESNVPIGSMALVGLPWEQVATRCPPGIFPACNNSDDSVSIAGLPKAIRCFVQALNSDGIFAKEINTNEVAFHSPYIADASPKIRACLEKIITSPKPRSARWTSSSIPPEQPGSSISLDKACSADYFVNNLVGPVYFKEAVTRIPENAFVLEIGPHSLFQPMLRTTLPRSCTIVGLTDMKSTNHLSFFFNAVGTMFQSGLNPIIANLYEKME